MIWRGKKAQASWYGICCLFRAVMCRCCLRLVSQPHICNTLMLFFLALSYFWTTPSEWKSTMPAFAMVTAWRHRAMLDWDEHTQWARDGRYLALLGFMEPFSYYVKSSSKFYRYGNEKVASVIGGSFRRYARCSRPDSRGWYEYISKRRYSMNVRGHISRRVICWQAAQVGATPSRVKCHPCSAVAVMLYYYARDSSQMSFSAAAGPGLIATPPPPVKAWISRADGAHYAFLREHIREKEFDGMESLLLQHLDDIGKSTCNSLSEMHYRHEFCSCLTKECTRHAYQWRMVIAWLHRIWSLHTCLKFWVVLCTLYSPCLHEHFCSDIG